MTRKTKILLAAGILTLVCGMAVAGVLLGVVSIPPIGEQLPEGANRASVTIVYPAAGGTWPLNSYVPIRVMARAAQPIASVDVFINNTPLEPRKGVVSTWAGQWDWQPGVAGDFVLTARVTTQAGAVSLSEPVRIHVGEAAAGMTMARAEGGETLADIAAAQGVSPEALQAGNPNTDLSAQLEPGQAIFVPDAPAPVESAQLIEPLPESQAAGPAAEGEAQDAEPGGGGEASPAGNSANFLNDLNFMLKSSEQNQEPAAGDSSTAGKDPAAVPQAPQLEGDFSGCDVKLRIGGWYYDPIDPLVIKRDEDGFFVYRSRDGGAFERIQTVAPIHDSKDDKNRELVYANEYGELTYYASAFNVLGESASNPITLPLSSFNCKAPSRAGGGQAQIHLEDGNLILPNNMDLAYMYLQINGSKAQRVPEADRFFQPKSGVMFNLLTYLDSLTADVRASDLEVHMEVWGWTGTTLIFVGEFDTTIHRSTLMICSVPGAGNCAGSNWGKWVTAVDLPQGDVLKMLEYDVRWQVSSLTSAFSIHRQLAASPFTSALPNASPNLLWSERMDAKGTEGTFVLPLGHLLYPDPPHTDLGFTGNNGFDYTSNGFLNKPFGQPFTLYLRADTGTELHGLKDVTNVVVLGTDNPKLPSALPPLASPYSSIYDIEILEDTYSRPDFYHPSAWGCVEIDEDPSSTYKPGDIVCPGRESQDDCAGMSDAECLALGMLDQLGWVYDQFIFLYEYLKTQIIELLWEITPYCKEIPESICTEAVHMGVDYAAEYYTGIPNDAPKSDELIADSAAKIIMTAMIEGEKYYTEQDFSIIEKACHEQLLDCEKKISNEIKVKLRQDRSYKAQVACWSGPEVLIHGQHQACLPPEIVCHPAPGALNLPAMVLVRVTRKDTPEANAVSQSDDDKYRVMVSVEATGTYPNSQSTFDEQLFETALVPIPWLAPGESATVPATLKLLGEGGGRTKLFYFGSTSHMKAVEACYSPDSTWEWVPCLGGGQDSWEFQNGLAFGDVPAGLSETVETP